MEESAWESALLYAFEQADIKKWISQEGPIDFAVKYNDKLYPNKHILRYCQEYLSKNYPHYSIIPDLLEEQPINDFLLMKGADAVKLHVTESNDEINYWIYSPGSDASFWEEFLAHGIMAIGWEGIGDLSLYRSKEDIKEALIACYDIKNNPYNAVSANFEFANDMKVGDIVICKRGRNKLLGYGVVLSDYFFNEDREEFNSCRRIDWLKQGEWDVDHVLVLKTLTNITSYGVTGNVNKKYYQKLMDMMNNSDDTRITNEIKILEFKKQIILQGPPGTGKTRLAKEMARRLIQSEQKVSIFEYVRNYIKNHKSDKLSIDTDKISEGILNDFREIFSVDKLSTLSIDEYTLGNGSQDSFCYWIEKKLDYTCRFSPGLAGTTVYGISYIRESGALRVHNDENQDIYMSKIRNVLVELIENHNYKPAKELKLWYSFILKFSGKRRIG